jgi:hypothetical protein
MTNEQIEELVRDLIEANLDKRNRKAAAKWLDSLVVCHTACLELGLLDVPTAKRPPWRPQ